MPRQLSRGGSQARRRGARPRTASTKLPRQLSRGRPQCVLGAPLLSGLNEVASAVKPRLEESLGRVASWRQASTKLPRQLSRGRDRLGASAERRVAASTKLPRQLSRGLGVLDGLDALGVASTKLPRQLSRGPTTLLVINSLCQSLNEVASAVKPRHTGINAVGGVIKGGLNEVASAVKPRPIVNASPPTWPLVASTKLPRQLSRGPVTLSPRECVPIWCLNEVASAVKPRLIGLWRCGQQAQVQPQRSCLGS